MRRYRNTKIVATLGPVSADERTIEALFLAGADVFRLNFSHGDHEGHAGVYDRIRAVESRLDRPIAVLADLQGPKFRLGCFREGSVRLKAGQDFRLMSEEIEGNSEQVRLPHPEIFASVKTGDRLYLDDGKVRLQVTGVGKKAIETRVVAGKCLSDRKGVNLPDTLIRQSALTEKDRSDLKFALSLGVEFIALSFVQRPEDLEEVRRLIKGRAALLVKMEKPSAIASLEAIVDKADALMVARGDLGVEMAPEDVPACQKQIIQAARRAGKPVIVATQMLESMIEEPVPTRAEASDVATAVFEGADAVMLSAESATGKYPREAVSTMASIITESEGGPFYRSAIGAMQLELQATGSDAISAAAAQVAETLGAKAIVTHSLSGNTALRAARERPGVPLICISARQDTTRRLALVWGMHPILRKGIKTMNDFVSAAAKVAHLEGFAPVGSPIVSTAGVPFGRVGKTNNLRIIDVGEGHSG